MFGLDDLVFGLEDLAEDFSFLTYCVSLPWLKLFFEKLSVYCEK